ncbi:unnamed protein product [Lampetra fluviatilis]
MGLIPLIVVAVFLAPLSAKGYTEVCDGPFVGRLGADSFSASSDLSSSHAPNFARLNRREGAGGWSPGRVDRGPWLQLELPGRAEVTALATQGRYGSSDWVPRYLLLYGDSAGNWRQYQEDGNAWVFPGNENSDEVVRHELQHPIVARYLRFVPLDWNASRWVGLRVEVYGCAYKSEAVFFDGRSLLAYRFEQKTRRTRKDVVSLRFRSALGEGVLLHGEGQRGDTLTLELQRGCLHLLISLGQEPTGPAGGGGPGEVVHTSASAGSLLDDQHWHDVMLVRSGRHGNLTVDRHTQRFHVKGDDDSLDLDYQLMFGGLPFGGKAGSMGRPNFLGCLENVYYSGEYVTDLAQRVKPQIHMSGNVTFGCPRGIPAIPVTFPGPDGHLALTGRVGRAALAVAMEFRTWDPTGLLLLTALSRGLGELRLTLREGKLNLALIRPGSSDIHLSSGVLLNNGEWHTASVQARERTLSLVVDGAEDMAVRSLLPFHVATGSIYYFGGGFPQRDANRSLPPFLGCMRLINIDDHLVDLSLLQQGLLGNYTNLMLDQCGLTDRCLPSHCENGGTCSQTWRSFTCSCAGTGYTGVTCHTPIYESSCEAYKHLGRTSGRYWVDPDGSGPLRAMHVYCNMTEDKVWTTVVHNNTERTWVSGSSPERPFVAAFAYSASAEQLTALISSAEHCQQEVAYYCKRSRLLNAPDGEPYTWWVGRTNEKQRYWGGSIPGVQKCACGITENCSDPKFHCNCDTDMEHWKEDSGLLGYKPHLPVMQLLIGDTDRALSEAAYRVGPLSCHGDRHFWNSVLFTTPSSYLHFPPIRAETSLDIAFFFKTTTDSGVILENMGASDFIRVQLKSPHEVSFSFDVGNGPVEMAVRSEQPLNDEEWHVVSAERSLKEASLRVDLLPHELVPAPAQGHTSLQLSSQLYVGSSVSGHSGFLGCVRSLRINGATLDLEERARVTPGVKPGCSGHCRSYGSLCRNGGRCIERYNGYSCDCSTSSYNGPSCTNEVGGFFELGTWIQYDLLGDDDDDEEGDNEFSTPKRDPSNIALSRESKPWKERVMLPLGKSAGTYVKEAVAVAIRELPLEDSLPGETVLLSFSTTSVPAILLYVGTDSWEYFAVLLQEDGRLQIRYQLGGETEAIYMEPRNLANGQPHGLNVTRHGREISVQLDHYAAATHRLHALQMHYTASVIYLGKVPDSEVRDSELQRANLHGFVGCLSRVQFNRVAPLKAALMQQGAPFHSTSSIPLSPSSSPVVVHGRLIESSCAVPASTITPAATSTEPWIFPDDSSEMPPEERKPMSSPVGSNSALIGGVIAVSIVIILCLLALVARYIVGRKGCYRSAVRGPEVVESSSAMQGVHQNFHHGLEDTRKEYFI